MAYPTALTSREAEIIRILKILTQHLNKSVVVGGYAVNALTSQRFSVDCDLVTDKKDFAFFDRILKNEGYKRRQRTRQFRGIHGGTTREYYTLIGGRRASVDQERRLFGALVARPAVSSMDRAKAYAYIDQHIAEHIAKLRELVRQPSISPENRGIEECAELVAHYLRELGCQGVQVAETSGNPVAYGRYDAGADKTVLVYSMYDTMPVDEPGWMVPPLEGRLVELPPFGQCLVARGAYNTKGELRAFLNACEAIRGAGLELPVNLLFVAEGEEELGSRHLPEFLARYEKELKAAQVLFFPSVDQNRKGQVIVTLGVKGIVYFELEVDGGTWGYGPTEFGIHGSHKAWVDSPAWRLIQALATMTSPDGNHVTIPGFYDHAAPPSPEDRELLARLEQTFDEDAVKEQLRVKRFIGDAHGVEALKQYLYSPTLNINGIWGGYTGPESKTLLPHKITAKVDVRLVPHMTPAEAIPKIRRHLDAQGFPEVQIRVLEKGYSWAKTSVKTPAAQALLKTYREFGFEPEVWPHMAGSAPYAMFNGPPLNLPFIEGGLGHGGLAHSPNEYLVIGEGGPTRGLASLEKSYVALLDNLSQML